MSELDLPLQVHGEVTDPRVDVFDREARFIERVLAPLVERFPGCASCSSTSRTRAAVQFVRALARGRRRHDHAAAPAAEPQCAVRGRPAPAPLLPAGAQERGGPRGAARRGRRRQTRASSSAPTARRTRVTRKESACGCAGVFSAHAGTRAVRRGLRSRRRPRPARGIRRPFMAPISTACRATPGPITLLREPWEVPEHYPFGADELVPLRAGERIAWRLAPPTSRPAA